jgi:hypothetical protein
MATEDGNIMVKTIRSQACGGLSLVCEDELFLPSGVNVLGRAYAATITPTEFAWDSTRPFPVRIGKNNSFKKGEA